MRDYLDKDGLSKADREVLRRRCWGAEARALYAEERRIQESKKDPFFIDSKGSVRLKSDYLLAHRYPYDWDNPEFRKAWVRGLFRGQNEDASEIQSLPASPVRQRVRNPGRDFESLMKQGSLLAVLQFGIREYSVPDFGVDFFSERAVKIFLKARGDEGCADCIRWNFDELQAKWQSHKPRFHYKDFNLENDENEFAREAIIRAASGACLYGMALMEPDLYRYNRLNHLSVYSFEKCLEILDKQPFSLHEFSETLTRTIMLHAPFGSGAPLPKADLEVVLTHPRIVPLPIEALERGFRVVLKDATSISEAAKWRQLFFPKNPVLEGSEWARTVVENAHEKWSQAGKDASASFSMALHALHDVTAAVDQRRARHYLRLAATPLFNLASSAEEMQQVSTATGVRPSRDQMFEILERAIKNIVKETYLKLDMIA